MKLTTNLAVLAVVLSATGAAYAQGAGTTVVVTNPNAPVDDRTAPAEGPSGGKAATVSESCEPAQVGCDVL